MRKSIISKTSILSLFFLSLFFVFGVNSLKAEASVYNFTEDFTSTIYKNSANTTATWNTSTGKLEFPFIDDGGNGSITRVQSLMINEETSKKITKATLTANIDMQGAGSGTSGIVIGYEISVDGGFHWDNVTGNVIDKTEHNFDYPGYDLRWRAWYSTASLYQNAPPFIDEINISYETQDVLTGSLSISRIYQRTDMLKIKLEADNVEDLSLSSFTVFAQKEVDGVNGYSPIDVSDISKIELYNGSTIIKNTASISNGYITFSNLSFVIPKNSFKELIIKGNISKSSDVRRYVVYLRDKSDGNGVFLDSSASSKIIATGINSNLKPTVNIVGGSAAGEWFYIADPPKLYSYEFVEDFSTNNHKDIFNTTADWSVDDKMVRLSRKGDYFTEESIAQSLKINVGTKMITGAKLTVDRSSMTIASVQDSSSDQVILGNRQVTNNNPTNFGVAYDLSSDGGDHWIRVMPGNEVEFVYPGYDLRWKIYLWTNITNNQNTPAINKLTVNYETTDNPINFLDISDGSSGSKNINVSKGDKNIKLYEMKLTANSSEDLEISSLRLQGVREGVYNATENDINSISLYDGDLKLKSAKINSEGIFDFSDISILVLKNESKVVSFIGDISSESTSKILSFGLNHNADNFPVKGVISGIKPIVRGHASGGFIYLIPDNIPIKAPDDYKIYVINNAQKKWIRTAEEFDENYDWNDIQEIYAGAVDSLPEVSVFIQDIKEGAIIRTKGDVDIYIVKYIGNKRFIRLILNPSVFRSYGHLRWEDVIEVEKETVNSFTTSNLVRNAITGRIYRLTANGDNGIRRHFRSISVMQRLGYDLDAVYEINETDENSYEQGDDLE